MTRADFLARLRIGLVGLPTATAADIVADYETHFADGAAAGRTEEEVAAALGDPDRLVRELRAEAGAQRWQQERSPSAASAAIFALVGLGAIDIVFLLPLLMGLFSAIFGVFIALIAVFFAGGAVMVAGPFAGPPGGPLTAILIGLGMMAASIAAGALMTVGTIGLVNACVWYARLHYRLLKPALEPQSQPSVSGASA
ncbi:MAG: DUF1700 domain-containing protein [Brevundimonas sp.]|nr:MAG: DUF1700 domain-containing protein [Brevundimonas sp.]